jgi:uncharacterized protein with von Willebrand factor type A (vWA) domain
MLCVNANVTSGSWVTLCGTKTAWGLMRPLSISSIASRQARDARSGLSSKRASRELNRQVEILDGLDPHDFRNLLLQNTFNAVGQSQLRHRAAAACTLKLNLDDSFVRDVDKSHVAAVGLESRPNLIEYRLNLFPVHSDPPQ